MNPPPTRPVISTMVAVLFTTQTQLTFCLSYRTDDKDTTKPGVN